MRECETFNSCSHEQFAAESRFAEETILFVSRMTGVDALALYLANDETGRYNFQRRRVSDFFHRQYETGMSKYDPFEYRRVAQSDIRVALLSETVDCRPEDQHYLRFIRAHGFSDLIETLFRSDGRVIGGLTLLLEEAHDHERVISALEAMQPYVEFNLRSTYGRRSLRRKDAAQRFLLSSRESDVVDLLIQGTTNNEIAESLHISLATVKTHVMKIFHKVGVSNRSTLVRKLSDYGFY